MAPHSDARVVFVRVRMYPREAETSPGSGLPGLASRAALVLRQMQTFKLGRRLLLLAGFLAFMESSPTWLKECDGVIRGPGWTTGRRE